VAVVWTRLGPGHIGSVTWAANDVSGSNSRRSDGYSGDDDNNDDDGGGTRNSHG